VYSPGPVAGPKGGNQAAPRYRAGHLYDFWKSIVSRTFLDQEEIFNMTGFDLVKKLIG
jgi:hypothetical protein